MSSEAAEMSAWCKACAQALDSQAEFNLESSSPPWLFDGVCVCVRGIVVLFELEESFTFLINGFARPFWADKCSRSGQVASHDHKHGQMANFSQIGLNT